MSLELLLEKYVKLPQQQVELVAAAEALALGPAVALVLPVWSGDAIVVLRRLSDVLLRFPEVKLRIVDADLLEGDDLRLLDIEGHHHGFGDAFWISDGAVVARLNRESEDWEAMALRHTERLVSPK